MNYLILLSHIFYVIKYIKGDFAMEIWEIVSLISLATFALCSTVVAFVKGFKKRKVMKNCTQIEQENDLYAYMVNECVSIEKVSTRFKSVMSKDELAEYKRSTVIKNMTLYSKACGYSWYNVGVWTQKLNDYITECNSVAGKKQASVNKNDNALVTPNAG